MMVKAEIEIDDQYGPIVKVTHNDVTVSVYLMDEIAILTTNEGFSFGIEVTGPWHKLKNINWHPNEAPKT